ncbi:lipoyl(octanoyl) transferase LipB [Williamsia sterculiae]|uniref:Octanoyltransferase n=1 Tax=Williamsia sterculiae TaxID=1344003 RepID=A0A1N7GAL5_9NOCA|nr:lipoyl(octanoyl) transferase LipB [Williamsia sterculiae]SIS09591.1 lipoyl(octanoyl) transferase [Williamsia sterculiae]
MPDRTRSCRRSTAPVEVRELGRVDYTEAFDLQHRLAAERADGVLDHDVVLLLEHPFVYTAGKRTTEADRPTDGSPVIDVDRGGKITWHGPGQLVAYPIVALTQAFDVVDYVRRLEQAMMTVAAAHGVTTRRVDGRSGVWVDADPESGRPQRKVGAIGIRVARGIALHGVALNADPELTAFSAIVPCGIPDAGVTSLSAETGSPIGVDTIRGLTADAIVAALDGDLPISDLATPEVPAARDRTSIRSVPASVGSAR